MKPIWIVDDDPSIRFVLERALARQGLVSQSFDAAPAVLEALQNPATPSPSVLVSDIQMPGGSGLDLLSTVKARWPGLPVIVMTAYSDLDSAVAAFQGGAFEYLAKPFDLNRALELITRAVQESEREAVAVQTPPAPPEMLGQASAMQEVFRAIGRLSQSQATVLITGESGTGKELVARALHKHSPRGASNGPFVAINTAAIPRDLLESELFGHERGAFTGAQALRRGRFEQAEGGTLFLDEIGDMPPELQTRLLRVLSDGHFHRVGGHAAIKANVRVIAATHQDLEQRVKAGAFREDLLHRLNVIRLRLPPLRERREDVPMLTRHFLQASAQQLGITPKRISEAALARLSAFDFPGNVRQLENICHWLSVMAPAQLINVADLPPEVQTSTDGSNELGEVKDTRVATAPSHTRADEHSQIQATTAHYAAALPKPAYSPATSAAGSSLGTAPDGATNTQSEASATTPAQLSQWEQTLYAELIAALAAGHSELWPSFGARFETRLILAALQHTKGRRIEAARRLGMGRNTLTRKIQELGLDAVLNQPEQD